MTRCFFRGRGSAQITAWQDGFTHTYLITTSIQILVSIECLIALPHP